MKIGYSNFLQEFVPAEMIEYGDCRDFQIVCPNCHEAVFKVAREGTGTQYLAHYRASKAQVAECELRVAAISKNQIEAQNIIAQGQHLHLFQSVLRKALLDRAASANWSAPDLDRMIQQMLKRPSYRALLREARNMVASGDLAHIWEEHKAEFIGKSPYYRETQLQFAKDMYAHVIAPNSFGIFAFGVSLAVCVSMALLTRTDRAGDRDYANVIGALMAGSDRAVQQLTRSDRYSLLLKSVILGASMSLQSWLVTLPFMDILRERLNQWPRTVH